MQDETFKRQFQEAFVTSATTTRGKNFITMSEGVTQDIGTRNIPIKDGHLCLVNFLSYKYENICDKYENRSLLAQFSL